MPMGRKTYMKKSTANKARRKGEKTVKYMKGYQNRRYK